MKIGFDGRYAEDDLGGVGKYIYSLTIELSKKGIRVVIFYSRKPKIEIKGKNIKSIILRTNSSYVFEQILLPRILKKEKIDLYHALGNMGVPLFCPIPSILTVHDIIPLEIPNYFSYSSIPILSKLSYLIRLKTSLIKADKIVTVCDYVKNELIKKLDISENKMQRIYSGVTQMPGGGSLPKALIGKKYILNNGGIDVRKNLAKLIQAFFMVRKTHTDLYLVITGDNKRIKKSLRNYDGVIFTGYVNERTLLAIIKNSRMICYPSLSEGFGFPVLEGFGNGIPVVSSNTSSIPEIADDAAIMVNPTNSSKIKNAIEKILNNRKIRDDLISKGYKRYNEFSWKKTINEYLDLYNHI